MHRTLRIAAVLAAGGIVLSLASSCIQERLAPLDRNRPPDTFITGAPREGGDAAVNVHFFWRGYDTDGTVLSYIYAVDDTTFTNWRPTSKTDSIFLFRVQPDQPDSIHTFYIAAVDNDGKRDPTPASRRFRAVDHAPPLVVSIWGTYRRAGQDQDSIFAPGDTVLAPAPGETGYDVQIHWTGHDDDGTIVRYFWNLGDTAPSEVPYEDTTTVSLGSLEPKDPADRTRHILYVMAEDNAGLRGGAGVAGVEPAQLAFTVDFTPHTSIDSVQVIGTRVGNGWDPVAYSHLAPDTTPLTTPPQTVTYTKAQLDAAVITFPAGALLRSYYRSTDPEDGYVSGIRWLAVSGLVGAQTVGEFVTPDHCGADTSCGFVETGPITSAVPSAPLTLWVRGRDLWNRLEEPGPQVQFLVNQLPVVLVDSIRVDPVTRAITFRWHSTDPDEPFQQTRYRASLDGGTRAESDTLGEGVQGQSFTFTAAYAGYDTTSGTTHTFVVEASNDLAQGRFSMDDTTFILP